MKIEIKALWIEALVSGRYKQAKGSLRTEDGYCCLGVLCDLHSKSNIDNSWCDTGEYTSEYKYIGFSTCLPPAVKNWAELDGQDPTAGGTKLSDLNDSGASFAQIAALINANL